MQQYQVPQFIAIEDRIIGPLTLKQFLYLLGAAGVIVLGWTLLHPILFFASAVPVSGLLVAMAFVKINERPLPAILFAAITYYFRPRLYLWRTADGRPPTSAPMPKTQEEPLLSSVPKLSSSRIEDLAWSLDIHERTNEQGLGTSD